MNRAEKFQLIWPCLVPLIPAFTYLKFGEIAALVVGLGVLLASKFIQVNPKIFETKRDYYVYCSIALGIIFTCISLGKLYSEYIIFVRLSVLLFPMALLFKYVEKVEDISHNNRVQ